MCPFAGSISGTYLGQPQPFQPPEVMEEDAKGSRDKSVDPGCLRFDLLRDRENPHKFLPFGRGKASQTEEKTWATGSHEPGLSIFCWDQDISYSAHFKRMRFLYCGAMLNWENDTLQSSRR